MPSRASPLPQERRKSCGSGLARDADAAASQETGFTCLHLAWLDPRRGFGHQRVVGPVIRHIT